MISSKHWQPVSSMQAILVEQAGPNSHLVVVSTALPVPTASQVLVKVHAAGVNRADLAQRAGIYPPQEGESEVLGLEVAGEVVAVGNQIHATWLDTAVFGLVPGGGYAQYAVIEVDQLIRKPANWSFAQAAASAEVFLTAYQALFMIGDLAKDGAALIHAGASGVGTAAIQLAKAIGAKVAVTVGSAEKAQACIDLGADNAVVYKQHDFAAVLALDYPQGFNVVIDPIAGDYLQKDISLLALDGKVVVLAMMGGRKVADFDVAPMFKKRGQLICSTLRNRSNAYKGALVAGFVRDFYSALENNRVQPVIGLSVSWQQTDYAHQQIADNMLVGKAVLLID